MRGAFDLETFLWKPNQPIRPFAAGAICDDTFFQIDRENSQHLLENLFAFMFQSGCKEWYAHNGSRFDVLFLCNAARKLGFKQTSSMNGAGKPIDWRFEFEGKAIHCLDTTNLVPAKLKDIAVDFELPGRKLFTVADYEGDVSKLSVSKIREGCLADCRLVLELLDKLESMVQQFGVKRLRHTAASNALAMLEATLKTQIPRHEEETFDYDLSIINELNYESYYGGRVEVLHHSPGVPLYEYDINSCYPYAMAQTVPWEFKRSADDHKAQWAFDNGEEGIFKAEVEVDRHVYLPPLPYLREGEALYFPVGKWVGWFAGNELRYALKHGLIKCRVEMAHIYHGTQRLRRFVRMLYYLKRDSIGAMREFAKLELNSCYGKFAQRSEFTVLKIFKNAQEAWNFASEHPRNEVTLLDDCGAAMVKYWRQPRHQHYALASYITAGGRILWHRKASRAKGLAYGDSDSFHCSGRMGESRKLGGLKLVREGFQGLYYAPKIYELRLADGSSHFASKGFTVGEKEFRTLVKGLDVEIDRVRQIKSQLRARDLEVMRLQEFKTWAGISNKRKPFPDGSTRPWSVEELEAGMHYKVASPIREFA